MENPYNFRKTQIEVWLKP